MTVKIMIGFQKAIDRTAGGVGIISSDSGD
jgi:hypothetical protein